LGVGIDPYKIKNARVSRYKTYSLFTITYKLTRKKNHNPMRRYHLSPLHGEGLGGLAPAGAVRERNRTKCGS